MNYPKIYLVLDNCFAIKRWVEPETWGPLIKELGFDYVEASFDNEADFFYSPQWYLDEWFDRVKAVEVTQNIRVANFLPATRLTGLPDWPIQILKWHAICWRAG